MTFIRVYVNLIVMNERPLIKLNTQDRPVIELDNKGYGKNSPERPRVEIPSYVAVNGHPGELWQGPISGSLLAHDGGATDPAAIALGRFFGDTAKSNIALRMSDGDIIMLFAEHPDEDDDQKRDYKITSVAMNKGVQPGLPIRTIELSIDQMLALSIESGEHLRVDNLVSDGTVNETITYNRTKPLPPHLQSVTPKSTIVDDFHAGIGQV